MQQGYLLPTRLFGVSHAGRLSLHAFMVIVLSLLFTVGLTPVSHASEATTDEKEVEELAMRFALGFWKGDPSQVVNTLHPELSKKGVKSNWRRTKKDIMDTLPPDRLELLADIYNAGGRLDNVGKPKVIVHEVSDQIAILELVNDVWFDFFHAVKINGEWSLLNCVYGSGRDYGMKKKKSDATQIEFVLRQYTKGIIGDIEIIQEVTHVGLKRRSVTTLPNSVEYLEPSSRSKMLSGAERFPAPQKIDFKLYNYTNEVASAKIDFGNWSEYVQLLKLNEKWQIVNSFVKY